MEPTGWGLDSFIVGSELAALLEIGFYQRKVPLFVLGAGVSAKRVPFIFQMAEWLVGAIKNEQLLSSDEKAPLLRLGGAIKEKRASRSDAAEFFSTLQKVEEGEVLQRIWKDFCTDLCFGMTNPGGTKFAGLFRLANETLGDSEAPVGASVAHRRIAGLLSVAACHVLNLNFDPLLYLAMQSLRRAVQHPPPGLNFVALHTVRDISTYYSSPKREPFQPCVVNARGDVFYQRCTNRTCPQHTIDHAFESHRSIESPDHLFLCPGCHFDTFRLQLSFPSYETKERLVRPVLEELFRFIGASVSAIIAIGLSGQWDTHLLSMLFNWSNGYAIPIIDVKPPPDDPGQVEPFERFRSRFLPSMLTRPVHHEPFYLRVNAIADDFTGTLYDTIKESFPGYLPSEDALLPRQLGLLDGVGE